MKYRSLLISACSLIVAATCWDCLRSQAGNAETSQRHKFPDILNIRHTPAPEKRCTGWYTDAGSWMGFTLPEKDSWTNGFCGPYSLDGYSRYWCAVSAASVTFSNDESAIVPDTAVYYPGETYIKYHSDKGEISQRLKFADANTALLSISTDHSDQLQVSGLGWHPDMELSAQESSVMATHPSGETVMVTFTPDVQVQLSDSNYCAVADCSGHITAAISFFNSQQEALAAIPSVGLLVCNPEPAMARHEARWQEYFDRLLRTDMPEQYDRIAAKAITTLVSNWRTHRGGLLHDGIIPSHAVDYFIGFWAWDSWRFSAATAKFAPELAKNNIRAMFDYQQPDGMVIDCIYTNPADNNARDSKPPLVSWAVDEILKATSDTLFLSEMYPQLLAYYKWWYNKRDHDHNGMCEYGSTDGTIEAAAWESGMDNAIRFDNARMVPNDAPDAYSFDQESVDLNAYLALECRKLRKFADILGVVFDGPDYSHMVADYFFNDDTNFYNDRRLDDKSYIAELGCEAYTPLWTGVASPEHLERMMPLLTDTAKFSTHIPFPTIAADNPKYNPRGYWRGPIWLDQTYFAINGLRRYGYTDLADEYTRQVFDRLDGLIGDAPIHENYDTHTGARLKAPNFSWSSSHLLMLYDEYGKKIDRMHD